MGTLEQVGGIVTSVLRYNLADLFQTFVEDIFGPQSLFHFGSQSLRKVFEAKCENRSGRYRQGLKNLHLDGIDVGSLFVHAPALCHAHSTLHDFGFLFPVSPVFLSSSWRHGRFF